MTIMSREKLEQFLNDTSKCQDAVLYVSFILALCVAEQGVPPELVEVMERVCR